MVDLLPALLTQLAHRQPPSPANALKHHLQIHRHLLLHHLRIHLKPHIYILITPRQITHLHTTLHMVTITHIIDLAILHRGIALRGQTPLHHDEATTPPTEKAAPEIHTAKPPLAIDIQDAIPTTRAGDPYIYEDSS